MRNWRFWLGLIISLAFVYWVVTQVGDLARTAESIRSAQYWYILPALVAYFAGVWVRAFRWRVLLAPVKLISSGRLFPVIVIGYMANDVLPARMGEFVRVYALGERESVSKTSALATIVVERIFDGLAMLIFMAVVSLLVPFDEQLRRVALFTGALFGLLVVFVLILAVTPRQSSAVAARLFKLMPVSLATPLNKLFSAGLAGLAVMRSPGAVAKVLSLSVTAWLCETAMYYLLALGFFAAVPVEAMLLTVAVANLGTMIPSSPGYVGTFHALGVFALGVFGLPADVSLAYITILHLTLIIPISLLGFYFLWRENLVGLLRGRKASETVG